MVAQVCSVLRSVHSPHTTPRPRSAGLSVICGWCYAGTRYMAVCAQATQANVGHLYAKHTSVSYSSHSVFSLSP